MKNLIDREKVLEWLAKKGVDLKKSKMALVAFRSFDAGKNKLAVYDDLLVWLDANDMATFKANTDPTRYFNRVATLKPGVWRYKKGNHGSKAYGPYPAYRQAAPVTVLRFDGRKPAIADTGLFGINIHHGSKSSGNSTSSLGCQTIPYKDWRAFKAYGDMLISRNGVAEFPYVLIDLDLEETIVGDKPLPDKKRFAMSANGIRLLEEYEGYYTKAYLDSGGVPTIGIGTIKYPNGKSVKMGDTCTRAQAEEWLRFEVAEKTKGIEPLIFVELNQNQIDALISFAYNIGLGAFKTSTLLKRLNEKSFDKVISEFRRWNKDNGKVVKGLINRREKEIKLFLS